MIQRIRHKIRTLRDRARFNHDFKEFRTLLAVGASCLSLSWNDRRMIYEDTAKTPFDTHYIYHPAWAARILAKTKPCEHVDISSKLDFSTLVSAFIPIKFYDYRPAHITLGNLTTEHADLTSLPFNNASVASLSCMHVVEHIGLGRYGDPLDPGGDLKAMRELARVLAPGGTLIFVVPVGKPKIVFNAHRTYAYDQIIDAFKDLTLKEFSLIPDDAETRGILHNAQKKDSDAQSYGCGCFWFTK